MPSVANIDGLLDACASSWFPLDTDPNSNLYRYVRDAINAYYGQGPNPTSRKVANFEEVLYQLNLLIPYHFDEGFTHGSNGLLKPVPFPDVRMQGRTPAKKVDGHVLRNLTCVLLDAIVDHFIEMCAKAKTEKVTEIATLRNFLAALNEEFDIGIVTLNYDDIFLQACPDLFTGFDAGGAFDPLSVFVRERGHFIYHLHGSIHFAMKSQTHDIHRLSWDPNPVLGSSAAHAFGRNTQSSLEGTPYPTSVIVAGHGKTHQLLRQPFRTYFAQTNRLIQEADSLLFLGYGFGDQHLNAAFSEVRNRRRPAVVVTWENNNGHALSWRNDLWSHNLLQVLPANQTLMGMPGSRIPTAIAEFKKANECEVSNDPANPVAIWYGGMLGACQHSEKILSYLR
jgi:hypothetical protein